MSAATQSVAVLTTGRLGEPPRFILPIAAPPLPPAKRQRAKLWELNESVHCSIIGTCLTTGELRRAMVRATQLDVSRLSDHDLHSQAVGLCARHNVSSKLLQKTLDQRHETVIKRFARLQGEAAILAAWAEARLAGDIPGAYWAVVTHPDVGHEGLRRAFGDVHMLSHLVGAANRADIRRLTALEQENASLLAKVERQQVRMHDVITDRDATIRRLSALTAHQVTAASRPDDDDALAAFRHLVGDLQTRLARETSRRERLEQRLAVASEAVRRHERRAKEAAAQQAQLQCELALLEGPLAASNPAADANILPAETVLYVGGRPGCVQQIRELMAAAGGALLCHDGGRHDHPSLLPGLISQADRVAFPVDCVSHDAALTVKRLCRQLGKTWTPLRSSGLGSFLAMLAGPRSGDAA